MCRMTFQGLYNRSLAWAVSLLENRLRGRGGRVSVDVLPPTGARGSFLGPPSLPLWFENGRQAVISLVSLNSLAIITFRRKKQACPVGTTGHPLSSFLFEGHNNLHPLSTSNKYKCDVNQTKNERDSYLFMFFISN